MFIVTVMPAILILKIYHLVVRRKQQVKDGIEYLNIKRSKKLQKHLQQAEKIIKYDIYTHPNVQKLLNKEENIFLQQNLETNDTKIEKRKKKLAREIKIGISLIEKELFKNENYIEEKNNYLGNLSTMALENSDLSAVDVFNGLSCYCNIKEEERKADEKKLFAEIKQEEAKRLRLERLKKKARQELLEEDFKNIPEDERIRHIPEDVKELVWRRDGGKCIECGNKERLEFDHIIPFSKGGSNTARNIQLLCERCNRSKKDKI